MIGGSNVSNVANAGTRPWKSRSGSGSEGDGARGTVLRWAARDELRGPDFRAIFEDLERYQDRFFSIREKVDWGSYVWPLQPLYEWSRRAEYPFVVAATPGARGARVLDAGSGVTFFAPYLAQRLGLRVECLDQDPANPERMRQVCEALGLDPPTPFHVGDLTEPLDFPDGTFDAVLCVSVLEHLPADRRLPAVSELWRLVAPGGRLVMTLDVPLTGEEEGIPLAEVPGFLAGLAEIVGPLPPLPSALPGRLLTPQRPAYPLAPLRVGREIVRGGPRGWWLHWSGQPLPDFKALACLLFSSEKA